MEEVTRPYLIFDCFPFCWCQCVIDIDLLVVLQCILLVFQILPDDLSTDHSIHQVVVNQHHLIQVKLITHFHIPLHLLPNEFCQLTLSWNYCIFRHLTSTILCFCLCLLFLFSFHRSKPLLVIMNTQIFIPNFLLQWFNMSRFWIHLTPNSLLQT